MTPRSTTTLLRILTVAALPVLATPTPAPAQDDIYLLELQDAENKLRQGRLAKAAAIFDDLLYAFEEETGPDRPDPDIITRARSGLWDIALRRGQYTEVAQAISARPEPERNARRNRLLLARARANLGRYDDAIAVLEPLVTEHPDDYEVRYRYARLLAETGRHDDARNQYLAIIDDARRRTVRDGVQLGYLGRAHAALGGAANIQRASEYLAESVRLEPDHPAARTAYGRLLFRVYGEAANYPSGEKHLEEVLERNGDVKEALLALYRLRRSNMQLEASRTSKYLERLLSLDPNHVPALVERAKTILDDRRFAAAVDVLDRALEINPHDKHALAHRAAASWLLNEQDRYRGFRRRALATDPHFAPTADRILADHLVALYRFGDAIEFYRTALEAMPDDVPTLHGLAKALVYTGNGEEAVEHLEHAKQVQRGHVHPWRNNVLAVEELIDEEYVVVERGGFELHVHRDDAEILTEYLLPAHEQAREELGEKYGHVPDHPIRVEVFHTWDDFSVRTIGYRGFTALGACFGPFITLVSPVDADLRRQDFMWRATVWHEYTHVLTLALSKHRVPRWLTEGFSVYEEKAKNPLWERGMTRELFDAFHNDDIPPVHLLNRLFRGPRILFGYYQGGLIVELLAERHGFDKVVELLKAYGEDLRTEEVFEKVFGISTREFDRQFLAWIEEEKLRGMKLVPRIGSSRLMELLGRMAEDPGDLEARVLVGWAHLQRDNLVDAGRQLRAVLGADPDFAPAHLLHAHLLLQRDRPDAALAAFEKGFAGGAEDFDSRIRCGRLYERRERFDEAIAQYQHAKACWPRCTEQSVAPELQLARVYEELDRTTEAMMERKTYCRRTARAFEPRLELAAYERRQENWKNVARYLEECIDIDPFMRRVHLELAEAYANLEDHAGAARELEMALAVPVELDRAYLGGKQPPAPDSSEERNLRARTWVRIARHRRALGDRAGALDALDKARGFPDTEAAAEAAELLELWR